MLCSLLTSIVASISLWVGHTVRAAVWPIPFCEKMPIIDGLEITDEQFVGAFKRVMTRERLRAAQQARANRFGIQALTGGALTIPARFARLGAKDADFADPVNYKYPVWLTKPDREALTPAQLGQVRNAPVRFSQFKNNYNPQSRAKVQARITRALRKFKIGEFAKADRVHTGAMIAFFPPAEVAQRLALPNGEPMGELHITMAFLGEAAELEDIDRLKQSVALWAKRQVPVDVRINGVARFNTFDEQGNWPLVALIDGHELGAMQTDLRHMLSFETSAEASTKHGFNPHITLAYIEPGQPWPVQELPDIDFRLDTLSLVLAGQRFDVKLSGGMVEVGKRVDFPIRIAKIDAEKQIAYGVALRPMMVDKQKDFLKADEVEETAHGYMLNSRKADLQHRFVLPSHIAAPVESHIARVDEPPNIKKGDWVVAMKVFDRAIWEGIKSSKINGFSIKGRGTRRPVLVQF